MEFGRRAKEVVSARPYTVLVCTEAVLLTALVLLGLSVDGGRVTSREASLFRSINGLPEALYVPMTIFQYAGVLAAPAVVAAVALILKRFRLAVLLVLLMPAKLWSEDIIKANFQRERPKIYIPDAILRGDVPASGLSFVSGHAIIVFGIATVLTPFISRWLRVAVWTVAGLCIVARVYLGAHLPRDVVGGAICGTMIGLALLGASRLLTRHYAAGS
ncbi:MAG TPA: phosphatase PAP2 family protein [Acidimicrobiales bacterium]|nr:phosphatase PAP2 family protein [Acidimicrobiales bacterium]